MKLERVERLNLGMSAGAIAASYALATPEFANSLAAGAVLEAINFGALHRGARHFFAGEIAGAGPWIGLFAMRFVLLAVGIFVLLSIGAHPVALLIGLSVAMPAVLLDAWRSRPPVLDPTTLPAPLPPDDPSWDQYSLWRAGEVSAASDDELATTDQSASGAASRGDR
jgi:hypothetical protein